MHYFFPIETLEPPLFHPGHLEDPFHCFELLLSHQRLPSSFLHALAAWSRKNAKREAKITARRLCAFDSLDEHGYFDGCYMGAINIWQCVKTLYPW